MGIEHEVAVKEKRVRAFLDEAGYDALVLTTQANFAWITGGGDNHLVLASDAGVASVLVTREAKVVVTNNIEAERIMAEEIAAPGFDLQAVEWLAPGGAKAKIGELTRGLKVASDTGTAGSAVEAARVAELRYSLTPEEIGKYRQLGAHVGQCIGTVCQGLRPGVTENEVAGRLAESFLSRGITPTVLLVAADDRVEKYRHPISTDKKAERCVMVVVCARRWGLIVSCTRLVHFGPPPTALRRKHDAVVAVDAALNLSTKVGTPLGEIFRAGQQAYADAGFPDEWRRHHQGGPTGYAGRDIIATPDEKRTVQPNQAFAWNPSITGTKSEDTILVTEAGIEWLSFSPDWPMLDVEFRGQTVQREAILVL